MPRYRHYKGAVYEVLFERVQLTERDEIHVVYRNINDGPEVMPYSRPYDMFHGLNEHGVKRFERLQSVKAQCGSCDKVDDYMYGNWPEPCKHCGSKSLWRVFDESAVEKQYILGVDLANGKDRTIIDGVMDDE